MEEGFSGLEKATLCIGGFAGIFAIGALVYYKAKSLNKRSRVLFKGKAEGTPPDHTPKPKMLFNGDTSNAPPVQYHEPRKMLHK